MRQTQTTADGLTAEEREILLVCKQLTGDIAARPEPASRWDRAELADLRKYGPRYSPSEWFGDGRSLPERFRVRFLRAVQNLESRRLVKGTNRGGRLAHLKLTAEGEALAATLAADPDPGTTPTDPAE